MDIIVIIVLAIAQGLTEFLPISSSGHLLLIEDITGYSSNGLLTSLVLHFGTLISVCIVMKDSIKKLFVKPYRMLFYLILATIPSCVLGMLLSDSIEVVFSDGKILPWTFFLTSVLLFLCQKVKRKQNSFTLKNSISMGLGQCFALLPGLSRSGTTIACALLSGADRESSGEFSFLMSIPIILGGVVVNAYKLLSSNQAHTVQITPLLIGMLVSCIVGLISIKKMLALINKGKFTPFCIYLVILSVICFINYYLLPIW